MTALGTTAAGVAARSEGADSNERARRLRWADAAVMLGPRLAQNGREWRVPSPAWSPQAAARWRAMGGRYDDGDPLVSFWFIPCRRIRLKELDRLYRELYPTPVRDASMRLAMSDYPQHEKIRRIVGLRQGTCEP